ncbi:hypothetical protein FSB08_39305 [Paraburkholderia sp. JPY432]|nr:hypothetical protein [Paraburkholderia youngii]
MGIDYHVELDEHYYSVSHCHAREQVDVRDTKTTVEIFLRGHLAVGPVKNRIVEVGLVYAGLPVVGHQDLDTTADEVQYAHM